MLVHLGMYIYCSLSVAMYVNSHSCISVLRWCHHSTADGHMNGESVIVNLRSHRTTRLITRAH